MSEDHLDPDIHLWPQECSECEKLEVKLEALNELMQGILDNVPLPTYYRKHLKRALEASDE